jgi:hypothetical protein
LSRVRGNVKKVWESEDDSFKEGRVEDFGVHSFEVEFATRKQKPTHDGEGCN